MARKRGSRRLEGSLAERAYLLIREKILKGVFPLGAALSRRRLAAQLGMSFIPVSEALQRLEHEGLVESRPRVGTRVRVPTTQDLRELHVIREALESQAARLFSEKASAAERRELQVMAARLDALSAEAAARSDPEFSFEARMFHLSFHLRIAGCTGCVALCEMLEKNQVLVFNWLCDVLACCPPPPNQHATLMEAVAGHDPEAADRAMRAHVQAGLDELQEALARQFGPAAAATGRLLRKRT